MEYALIPLVSGLAIASCVYGYVAVSQQTENHGANVLSFVLKDMDGKEIPLAGYSGKVILIVNVASKCGFTPQYAALEALYKKYKDRGLEILAFPANDFLWQEPGSNKEILSFCKTTYDVTFPVFSKIHVRGKDIAPLYVELTSKEQNGKFGGKIGWNFTKFLVNRDGNVIGRFGPATRPDAPEVVSAIEEALG